MQEGNEKCVTYNLDGKLKRRASFHKPRHGCEDNIKMKIKKLVACVNWIQLVHESARWRALVATVMNF